MTGETAKNSEGSLRLLYSGSVKTARKTAFAADRKRAEKHRAEAALNDWQQSATAKSTSQKEYAQQGSNL